MGSSDSGGRPQRGRQQRKCHICPKVFYKAEHLARHVRSHTKEKPFRCAICDKVYSRHDVLLRHVRAHTEPATEDTGGTGDTVNVGDHSISQTPPRSSGSNRSTDAQNLPAEASSAEAASALMGLHALTSSQPFQAECMTHAISDFLEPNHTSDGGLAQPRELRGIFPQDTLLPEKGQGMQQQDPGTIQGTMTYQSTAPVPLLQEQQYCRPALEAASVQTTQSFGFWDYDPNMQLDSWLLGEDFDIRALNTAIAASINPFVDPLTQHPLEDSRMWDRSYEEEYGTTKTIENTKERWHTYLLSGVESGQQMLSGTNTPRHSVDQGQVDEVYRATLQTKLRQPLHDDWLPSTHFLNLCIRLYFKRVNALFPIVHSATFRPSAANSLLLLSMCSIGSLFVGSATAAAQGRKIFELLNKSILASWETLMSRSNAEALSVIRASLIGQTYGMLSGEPTHLVLVDTFHGGIIAWARQCKLFNKRQSLSLDELERQHAEDLERVWRDWIASETAVRVVLALYIHDAELATVFHHEPILRHEAHRVPLGCSDRAWTASTAELWKEVMQRDQAALASQNKSGYFATEPVLTERFNAYAHLECIAGSISDSKQRSKMNAPTVAKFVDKLILWHQNYHWHGGEVRSDLFCCTILWHYLFISLFVDFDLLEQSVGRDGPVLSYSCQQSISGWVMSTEAKRCIVHAALIQNQVESLPVGTEPAIHVPRILFHCALVWYCFTSYRSPSQIDNDFKIVLQCPEFRLLDVKAAQIPSEARDFKYGRTAVSQSGALCGLIDHLQKVSHWGISRRFASILSPLIYSEGINGEDLHG